MSCKIKLLNYIHCVFILFSVLYKPGASVDQGCDYYQSVQAGKTYYVYSPNYPRAYPAGKSCRWIAVCPQGQMCQLNCTDLNMPTTPDCSGDRLLISRTGDPSLSDAERYCGRGFVEVTSIGQTLSVGLQSSIFSRGGRFSCTLTAASVNAPGDCDCGWKKEGRIVGGVETGINEFPMMVGLKDLGRDAIYCGAVIVDTRYVLTAAHCLINQPLNNLGVLVGEHNINQDNPARMLLRAASIIIHPQFNQETFDNDLAIIRTRTPIRFSENVGPACLPFRYSDLTFAGESVTALGWGSQSFGGPTSEFLQKVQLNVVEQETCRSSFSSLTPRQMCTFTDRKDTCQDDSGGPLLWRERRSARMFHVGVVSAGRSCASSDPAVNARVTEFLRWVMDNTPGANYCVK